jgi:hypothetical protein
MNPVLMWLRSHPAERTAIVVLALLLIGGAWEFLSHRTGAPSPSPTPAAGVTSTPGTGSAPTPTPTPLPAVGSTPAAPQLSAAESVATSFLVILNSPRYNQSQSQLQAQERPYVTDAMYAQLAPQGDGESWWYQQAIEDHEIDTASVTQLTPEGYAADGTLGFLARVQITKNTDKGSSTSIVAYEVFLTGGSSGWLVSSDSAG